MYSPYLKTKTALELIENEKLTAYAAAKRVGIALSTIYRAKKRIKEQENAGQENKNGSMDT